MNLIETYNGSGFYAQYADSALYDANGTPLTSYLTAVPAGTMNESAFSYDASDNITAYNGSAFKAGDEFPQSATEAIETVTANSADWNGTTETVSSNSGAWGGSALPISAGPGIKFEMVNNTLVASTDETVLWSGSTTTGCTLSEYATNFDKVQVTYYSTEGGTARPFITEFPATALSWNFVAEFVGYNDYLIRDIACYSSNDCLNYAYERGSHGWYDISQVRAGGNSGTIVGLTKVIGINRIAGGN